MKRIIKLTEENLIRIIKTIVENVNLDDYDDSDFIDVFIFTFRKWIEEKLGDDAKKYPMSLLVKRFGWEFIKNYIFEGSENSDIDDYEGDTNFSLSPYDLSNYGRKIVEKNKYQLPSLYKEEKFTEKYGKALNRIVESLGLPPFVSLEFKEDKPYVVVAKAKVNFVEMLHEKTEFKFSRYELNEKLRHYIKNFLGVDFGNPSHGELFFDVSDVEFIGEDEWIKNVLNKSLKKQIRELPGVRETVHRMGFETYNGKAILKIYFKDRWTYDSKLSKYEIKKNIQDFFTEVGYGPNFVVKT